MAPYRTTRRPLAALALALLVCVAVVAMVWQRHQQVSAEAYGGATHLTIAGRDVAMWKPAGATPPTGFPLIVFSHGFTGCNTQSTFLMQALAGAGYMVLAPNHNDALCGTARSHSSFGKIFGLRPEQPFGDPEKWSASTYLDRRADIESVLDAALNGPSFQGVPIDPNRVGIAGHSLGGYTALGLAGGWPSWKDARIKAVLALSPHCSPFVQKGDLRRLGVPVMYQGGTLDMGETPLVERPGGAYEQSSTPKYFVDLKGAGHLAWTDINRRYQDLIDAYSIAFFDRYLKGETKPDPLAPLETKPLPAQVSDLRVDLRVDLR